MPTIIPVPTIINSVRIFHCLLLFRYLLLFGSSQYEVVAKEPMENLPRTSPIRQHPVAKNPMENPPRVQWRIPTTKFNPVASGGKEPNGEPPQIKSEPRAFEIQYQTFQIRARYQPPLSHISQITNIKHTIKLKSNQHHTASTIHNTIGTPISPTSPHTIPKTGP